MTDLKHHHKNPEFIDFLGKRRSTPIRNFMADAIPEADIQTILSITARVPDHGKLAPWRFIVIEGDSRQKAGEKLKEIFAAENAGQSPEKLEIEAGRFNRAPLVIAVISTLKESKHPEWEQILSAGAACMNLCLAANTLGYGSDWLTEWYAYNPVFLNYLRLSKDERIAGFIYIGKTQSLAEERPRPDLNAITSRL